MNSKLLLAALAIVMLLAAGCVSVIKVPGSNDSDDIGAELDEIDELVSEMDGIDAEDAGLPTKTVLEGEKVSFPNLQAVDPDGDAILYTFTEPLNSAGEWQTKAGDAGNYRVTITASDGESQVSQDVLVIVKSLNKAPVLKQLEDIEIEEGDTVQLNPVATDADGDDVEITFSGWMDSPKMKTGYDDEGTHLVTITASDGKDSVKQTIRVIVENVNRPPKISSLEDISIDEGGKVSVSASAEDPDGDDVEISFSEPLDANGNWQTAIGDAGKYMIKVTASDGGLEAEDTFYLTIVSVNQAPSLEGVADIEVDEGDRIELELTASDNEGDDVEITFSQPLDEDGVWQTGYGDAGEYVVTATASDGFSETKETFTVKVNDVNRAPVFSEGSFQ